jgi:hypothetical protein
VAKVPVMSPAAAAPTRPLSSAWHLFTKSCGHLIEHWRFWLVFSALFGLLNLIFVHNFSTDVVALKENLAAFLGAGSPATGLGTYALLVANNSAAPGAAAAYQYCLLVIASLACIWALRQFMSESGSSALTVRDSLYQGMYPLIPFILVGAVLILELVPLLLAGSIYSLAIGGGVTRTVAEQMFFIAFLFAAMALSIWLMVRSIFALYIVTLAGMRPVEALRDAARIVKGRQLGIIRRLLFLVLVLLVGSLIILLPVILLLTPATQIVFFALSIFILPFVHTYLYSLYRELLG